MFEDDMALALSVFWLFVLIVVAIVALGYGIGVEGSVRRAGRSRHLLRQNSQLTDSRRTEELQPPFDNHSR